MTLTAGNSQYHRECSNKYAIQTHLSLCWTPPCWSKTESASLKCPSHTPPSLFITHWHLPLALISLQVERKNVRYLGGRWEKWHNNKPITGTHQPASGWWFSPELHHKLCLRHCCCRTWWWWQCESLTELSTNNNRLKIQINSHQPLSWINVVLFDHDGSRSGRGYGWQRLCMTLQGYIDIYKILIDLIVKKICWLLYCKAVVLQLHFNFISFCYDFA